MGIYGRNDRNDEANETKEARAGPHLCSPDSVLVYIVDLLPELHPHHFAWSHLPPRDYGTEGQGHSTANGRGLQRPPHHDPELRRGAGPSDELSLNSRGRCQNKGTTFSSDASMVDDVGIRH